MINDLKLSIPRSLPDHSMISCEFDLSRTFQHSNITQMEAPFQSVKNVKPRKNIRKIDANFMCSPDIIQKVNLTIQKLENTTSNQNEIDGIYSEITNIFRSEIDKLPNVPNPQSKKGRQSLRKACPFWDNSLQNLWEIRCNCEKLYLSFKCSGSVNDRDLKQRLRNDFKTSQDLFDKLYRKTKRKSKTNSFQSLAQLAEDASTNPSEIWKRLKALSEPKSKTEIFEIIRQDGTISSDIKEILTQWHTEFSECFAGLRDNIDLAFDDELLQNISNLKK